MITSYKIKKDNKEFVLRPDFEANKLNLITLGNRFAYVRIDPQDIQEMTDYLCAVYPLFEYSEIN